MHRSLNLLAVLFCGLFFVGVVLAKPQKPSADMILILIHHKSGPNDLDAKGLTEDKTMKAPAKADVVDFEVYDVPYPEGTADYFGYRVWLHRQSGRYWIYMTGGAGAVNIFYGPGLVKDLRM